MAARAAWILGAAVVLFAGVGAYLQKAWEEAITVIVGLVIAIAPWMLDFADQDTAAANFAVSGALVIIFGIWGMLMDMKKLKERQHAHGAR